jgi:hypothetical protein
VLLKHLIEVFDRKRQHGCWFMMLEFDSHLYFFGREQNKLFD